MLADSSVKSEGSGCTVNIPLLVTNASETCTRVSRVLRLKKHKHNNYFKDVRLTRSENV